MVEVLVAMGVMFTALIVLAFTMLSSLSAVGFSRQRTEATALANQALEQIRALPANQLFMSSGDLAGDPQLVSCGPDTCLNSRKIPVADFGSNPSTTPFTPTHITTTPPRTDNTVYTIKSYLTYDPLDSSNHTLVATVQVSWTNSQKGGIASHLQVETKIYNNQFNPAPPGVHTFIASASGTPGAISVTGTILSKSLTNTVFNLPATSAGMNGTSFPGTTNVGASGGTVTAGISQSGVTAAGTQVLNTPAASAAAVSPAGSSPTWQTDTQTPTVLGPLSGALGLDLGTLTGAASVGSTEVASAEAASAANGALLTSGSPVLPNNGLGFGQGTASQTGAVGVNVGVGATVLGIPVNLLSIGLVNLVPTGNATPDYSKVAQNGSPNVPLQQTYTAAANQQFSELDILNLAVAGIAQAPLLKLTGFQQSVAVCAGPGTCPATTTVDTGSISILGNPVISVQTLLSDSASALALVNSTLTGINIPLGGVTTLGITGTGITVGPPASSAPGSASVGSPLTINLSVDASVLGVSLLHVNISVNLGSIQAQASYS